MCSGHLKCIVYTVRGPEQGPPGLRERERERERKRERERERERERDGEGEGEREREREREREKESERTWISSSDGFIVTWCRVEGYGLRVEGSYLRRLDLCITQL